MWTEPKMEGDEKPEGRMAACMVGGVMMPEVEVEVEVVAKAKVEEVVVKTEDSAAKGNVSDDKESSPALVTSAASSGGAGDDGAGDGAGDGDGAGAPLSSSLAEVLYIFGGSTMKVDSNDCYEVRNFKPTLPDSIFSF